LGVAAYGTHHLLLARETAVPMDGDVHVLAALFDMSRFTDEVELRRITTTLSLTLAR